MKKLVLTLLALVGISFAVKAQEASGSCKLPGTYEYVNVDYYSDGHLAITNNSGVKINSLKVKVTYTKGNNTKVLYNQTIYDGIPADMTTTIKEGVEKCSNCDGTFTVEVGNPICKKQND